GRLKVSFNLPFVEFQAELAGFAEKALARTLATVAASLSLLGRSPSRQPEAGKRMVRSISRIPLDHPAATTPAACLNLAINPAARSGSALSVTVCSPARSTSQVTARLLKETSTSCPFRLLRKSATASSLTRTPIASGDT